MWEVHILGLVFWKVFFFFFFWDGEAVLSSNCCQCPFPLTMQGGSLFSQLSPTFIICQLVKMTILTGGIWFFVVVLIGIPPVIFRDVEHLVLRPSGFFFPKGCEEILYVTRCFLKGSYVWNWFLQYPPQDLSRGLWSLTATQVPVNTSGQVVVTGNVQMVAALCHAQLWFHLQPEP